MSKQLVSSIFSMVLVLNTFAQDNWKRYSWGTADREGFTVLLPTIPEQIVRATGEQGISAFTVTDFVTYNVIFKNGVSKEQFDKEITNWMRLVGGGQGSGSSKEETDDQINMNRQTREVSICGYAGIEFGNSNSIQQFFHINNRLYHVWVTGANKSNPDVAKFFNSFSLAKPWILWKGNRTNEDTEGFGVGNGSETPFAITVCQNIGKTEGNIGKAKLPSNSVLRLISKPSPVYPEEARKKGIQGTVILKITFLKDGTIGNISVLKGANKELNENAIKAAKLIQFEPQRRNGKPVNASKIIQYDFFVF